MRVKKAGVLILLPALAAGADRAASPGVTARTGAIEGVVTVPSLQRRTADRYAGGPSPAQRVQDVPPVVYLRGSLPGASGGATRRVQMVQRDTAFVPAAVAIPVGGTVDFPNEDPFFHNVFAYSPAERFDLGRYPQGESKEVTFDTPGVVEVFCEVHDFMRAVIVVTESPFSAVVAEDGSFRIDGVPAGNHMLVVWHPDLRSVERSVTVTDGGTSRVEVELRR